MGHAAAVCFARADAAPLWDERTNWLLLGQARSRVTQIRLYTDHQLKNCWNSAEDHGTAEHQVNRNHVQSSDGPRPERGPVLNYSGQITINSGIDRRVAIQPGLATECDRRHPPPC